MDGLSMKLRIIPYLNLRVYLILTESQSVAVWLLNKALVITVDGPLFKLLSEWASRISKIRPLQVTWIPADLKSLLLKLNFTENFR
jgi:hypothetical protein